MCQARRYQPVGLSGNRSLIIITYTILLFVFLFGGEGWLLIIVI